MDGTAKAAILTQVGQHYFGAVGQYYLGANNHSDDRALVDDR